MRGLGLGELCAGFRIERGLARRQVGQILRGAVAIWCSSLLVATTPHFGLPDSGDTPTVIAGWREPAANRPVGRATLRPVRTAVRCMRRHLRPNHGP